MVQNWAYQRTRSNKVPTRSTQEQGQAQNEASYKPAQDLLFCPEEWENSTTTSMTSSGPSLISLLLGNCGVDTPVTYNAGVAAMLGTFMLLCKPKRIMKVDRRADTGKATDGIKMIRKPPLQEWYNLETVSTCSTPDTTQSKVQWQRWCRARCGIWAIATEAE